MTIKNYLLHKTEKPEEKHQSGKKPGPRRLFCLLLCISLTFLSILQVQTVSAESSKKAEKQKENKETENPAISISAKSAVLIENNTGTILYEKEKDKERIPASITKIMTLLLIFDAIDSGKIKETDTVTVSEHAAKMGGSQVFLEPGETQTVDTMIKCISIASANDAAVAMAEFIGGSEENFVKLMNQKAKKLGMKHTHFKNCNGLDDSITSGHYSSAYDVALMSQALVTKYPEISKYSTTWMDEITHHTKKGDSQFGLTNTNKLVRTYDGITGLKTGSTSKAKYCLSATAKRNGVSLTAVIMAAPDPKVRFTEAASLLDYGFANCRTFLDKTNHIKLTPQKVSGGKEEQVIPRIEKNFTYTLVGDSKNNKLKRKIYYQKNLKAPIKEGDIIGGVIYYLDGTEIGQLPVRAAQSIEKATLFSNFSHLLRTFCFAK